MKKYTRVPFEVTAVKYEVGQGMEDGFRLLSQVVTNEGLNTENLVKITREDGSMVLFLSMRTTTSSVRQTMTSMFAEQIVSRNVFIRSNNIHFKLICISNSYVIQKETKESTLSSLFLN